MRRREFITGLSGVAVMPLAARGAQQPAIPVIGFVSIRSSRDSAYLLAAFRKGLDDGLIVGALKGDSRSVVTLFRLAEQTGQFDEATNSISNITRVIVETDVPRSEGAIVSPARREVSTEQP